MRSIEVLVLGGGASGMMAAIMAAREHAHVMILEKKNRLGKKLLATGNGRCNFTIKAAKKYAIVEKMQTLHGMPCSIFRQKMRLNGLTKSVS